MIGALELRRESDGTPKLGGQITNHNIYSVGGAFREVIEPNAFRSSLSRPDLDTVLLVEHDRRCVLARTPATLSLTETREGLTFIATLDPSDPLTQQTVARVERGVLKECSFGFRCPPGGDSWSDDRTLRTIHEADVHRGDVSLCVYGCNPATGAQVLRSSPEERRAVAEAVSRLEVFGPALALDRRAWANQHGKACETCDGSGQCPDCDGQGWSTWDNDSDGRAAARGNAHAWSLARSAEVPRSNLFEFAAELEALRLLPPSSPVLPAARVGAGGGEERMSEFLRRRWTPRPR